MRIAVIGAGSWGTTLAALAARTNPVVLWARRAELAEAINTTAENPDYLPGRRLPYGLRATADPAEAVAGADAVVMAVPSHGFREVLTNLAPGVGDGIPILSLTKGIEERSLQRMTEVVAAVLPEHDRRRTGVLTGPNLASEIMGGAPAAAVIGMQDEETAALLQSVLMDPTFRVYTNTDVTGCELAGALKNVMAIAAGMAKGLGFGQNTLAALITRALAEITRLGVAMGGRAETFAGLAGMGDLIATCESDASRNNRVGTWLAQGRSLDEIVSEMQMVAEGVKTVRPVLELAARHGVDMPIASQVERVLYGGAHPREAVLALMTREARSE
ncbi:MAG TPA: NAD(P)H-dependent glycerol-3-phosphate dehydrogenase [Acidimicrobiia bacterium]|nr:NAD(P)H-dependent glycerol-3-phosphate dehydrogenase [Acidimicrobiia bacterium]